MSNETKNIVIALAAITIALISISTFASTKGFFDDPVLECDQEKYDYYFEKCIMQEEEIYNGAFESKREVCQKRSKSRFCWKVVSE